MQVTWKEQKSVVLDLYNLDNLTLSEVTESKYFIRFIVQGK